MNKKKKKILYTINTDERRRISYATSVISNQHNAWVTILYLIRVVLPYDIV